MMLLQQIAVAAGQPGPGQAQVRQNQTVSWTCFCAGGTLFCVVCAAGHMQQMHFNVVYVYARVPASLSAWSCVVVLNLV